MGDTSWTVGNDFWKQIRPIRPNRCITQPLQRLHTLFCARLLDRRDRRKIRDAWSGKVGSDLALPSPRAFFAWAFTISARYQRPLGWCYTERFPATIFSATQRCWNSVILAGKRDSLRHSTTSFSENVVVSYPSGEGSTSFKKDNNATLSTWSFPGCLFFWESAKKLSVKSDSQSFLSSNQRSLQSRSLEQRSGK